MAHWKGHSERHLRAVEEAQAKRDEWRYEAGLTKWFKRRRACVKYCKKNILYYIAGISFMRGIEPLFHNISIIDLTYHHVFTGNIILIIVAAILVAINIKEK